MDKSLHFPTRISYSFTEEWRNQLVFTQFEPKQLTACWNRPSSCDRSSAMLPAYFIPKRSHISFWLWTNAKEQTTCGKRSAKSLTLNAQNEITRTSLICGSVPNVDAQNNIFIRQFNFAFEGPKRDWCYGAPERRAFADKNPPEAREIIEQTK